MVDIKFIVNKSYKNDENYIVGKILNFQWKKDYDNGFQSFKYLVIVFIYLMFIELNLIIY